MADCDLCDDTGWQECGTPWCSEEGHGGYCSCKAGEESRHEDRCHPDWEYTTTTGQRKAFDDSKPPEGDGWIRNVHVGDNGWERFDYTEESYWMRPKRREAS